MAALQPDQLEIDADGATARPPGTQVIPEPGRYEIDTTCSAVTFRTRHLFGLAPVRGSFAIRTGTITITEPLTDSSIHAEIDPASFRTDNGQRDGNVRTLPRYLSGGAVRTQLTAGPPARTITAPYRR